MNSIILSIIFSINIFAQIETNTGTSGGGLVDNNGIVKCEKSKIKLELNKAIFSEKYGSKVKFNDALNTYIFSKQLEALMNGSSSLPPLKMSCNCSSDDLIIQLKVISDSYYKVFSLCQGYADQEFKILQKILGDYE